MMVSHEFKCIFIHIPKTGGTSVETLFGNEKHNHDKRERIIEKIGMPSWKSYLKFSIVRNPWDRMVSAYSYVKRPSPFKKWLDKDRTDWFMLTIAKPQLDWISENGTLFVDYIIRFENYSEELQAVCDKLGKKLDIVPHTNKSQHKHYSFYYDEETIEIVRQMHKRDIDYFGYKFKSCS